MMLLIIWLKQLKDFCMKNNKMRVLFLSKHSKVASNVMRGQTVAKKLSSMGIKTSNITFKRFKIFKKHYLHKYDIFIFIKRLDLELAKGIKKHGKTIVVDIVDNYDFDKESLWSKENIFVDYYIANTQEHQNFTSTRFNINPERIFVIEHHHSNLHNITKKVEAITTVGFIGASEQFNKSEKLMKFLNNNNNLNFYIPEKSPVSNKEAVDETSKLDCFILNVDKNIENSTENIYDYILKFKPAQKILLPFSIGIPTVLAPYTSYIEAVNEAGYSIDEFLMASNEDELIANITKLLNFNSEQLNDLIEKQKKVASLFTLEEVSKKYIKMFETIYENKL